MLPRAAVHVAKVFVGFRILRSMKPHSSVTKSSYTKYTAIRRSLKGCSLTQLRAYTDFPAVLTIRQGSAVGSAVVPMTQLKLILGPVSFS